MNETVVSSLLSLLSIPPLPCFVVLSHDRSLMNQNVMLRLFVFHKKLYYNKPRVGGSQESVCPCLNFYRERRWVGGGGATMLLCYNYHSPVPMVRRNLSYRERADNHFRLKVKFGLADLPNAVIFVY